MNPPYYIIRYALIFIYELKNVKNIKEMKEKGYSYKYTSNSTNIFNYNLENWITIHV